MAFRRNKGLSKDQIQRLMNASDSSCSELSSKDDGWESDSDDEIKISNNSRLVETDLSILETDCEASFSEKNSIPDDEAKGLSINDSDVNLTWNELVENKLINITEENVNGGPIHNLPPGSEPIDFLKLLFSENMCETIRINTNLYAENLQKNDVKKFRNWKPIENTFEIWCFLSIMLIMGINKLPKLSDYWSANPILGNNMIKSIMHRDRFLQILGCFHLSNKNEELKKDDDGYNIMQKLDPFLNDLKGNFLRHFSPYRDISIDEAMVKYKGRLGIIQYMPLKPAKRGIKIWMMCSSFTGYVINFDVYGGKNDKIARTGKGLGYDVVWHLTRCLQNKGHHIYFDRFFTNVQLMRDLLSCGQYSCGTIMSNRKFLPKDLQKIKLNNSRDSKCYQCVEVPNMLCTVWKDKKEIMMLSTQSINESVQISRRVGGEKVSISSPQCFLKYNKYMGGVDLADQMRKYYSLARKSRKWWLYLFWFLFDTAIFNAFILYTLTNMPLQKRPEKFIDFKMHLIRALAVEVKSKELGEIKRKRKGISSMENICHKKVKIVGRKKNCKRCSKLKIRTHSNYPVSSSFMCDVCQICLCVNCFGPYHDELYSSER